MDFEEILLIRKKLKIDKIIRNVEESQLFLDFKGEIFRPLTIPFIYLFLKSNLHLNFHKQSSIDLLPYPKIFVINQSIILE